MNLPQKDNTLDNGNMTKDSLILEWGDKNSWKHGGKWDQQPTQSVFIFSCTIMNNKLSGFKQLKVIIPQLCMSKVWLNESQGVSRPALLSGCPGDSLFLCPLQLLEAYPTPWLMVPFLSLHIQWQQVELWHHITLASSSASSCTFEDHCDYTEPIHTLSPAQSP